MDVVFELHFTDTAQAHYDGLPSQKLEKIKKALRFLKTNPRHPGLNTHIYHGLENPIDSSASVFEAYAENNTPGAYRIFWVFGPQRGQITVVASRPIRDLPLARDALHFEAQFPRAIQPIQK